MKKILLILTLGLMFSQSTDPILRDGKKGFGIHRNQTKWLGEYVGNSDGYKLDVILSPFKISLSSWNNDLGLIGQYTYFLNYNNFIRAGFYIEPVDLFDSFSIGYGNIIDLTSCLNAHSEAYLDFNNSDGYTYYTIDLSFGFTYTWKSISIYSFIRDVIHDDRNNFGYGFGISYKYLLI